MTRLILVGCSQTKALEPPPPAPWPKGYVQRRVPACELYVSPLFKKRRAYAEREVAEGRAVQWAILSALHQCVPPERELAGYDLTMSEWGKAWLPHWGHQVAISLRRDVLCDYGKRCDRSRPHALVNGRIEGGPRCTGCMDDLVVEIHAGAAYVEPARPFLEAEGVVVDAPLAGLGIGEQLAWYTAKLNPQPTLWEPTR